MEIFFTGATGFVGSYIAGALSEKHNIIVPTRDPDGASKSIRHNSNIKFVKFEGERLGEMVENARPDVVVNLLGIIKENAGEGTTFERVHYEYVVKLVEGAKKAGVRKFIQMSALGSDKNSKSRYLATKARAEEYLSNSGMPYTIFRPSIILGSGQKMFEDFSDFTSFSPFFPAPNHKLQPIHINDVRDCFLKAIHRDLANHTYDLCGAEVISFRELFQFVLKYLKVKRPVFTAPDFFFRISLPIMSLLPKPPLTLDQYYMFQQDNICTNGNDTGKLLGVVRDAFDIG